VTESEIVTEESVVSDLVVENVIRETITRVWDPAGAWRELNFPVMPEGDGDFQTVAQEFIPVTSETIIPKLRGTPDIKGVNCRKALLNE